MTTPDSPRPTTSPTLLLVDEPSLGLAPTIVQLLLTALRAAADAGTAVLVVEQHAEQTLQVADRAYVMIRGAIELESSGAEMRTRIGEIERSYLGGLG